MDINSLFILLAVLVAIWLFIKLVVSPLLKAVIGIVIFVAAIYVLQRYFNFNLDKVFRPFALYFNSSKWGWLSSPIDYGIKWTESFLNPFWQNFTKSLKQ